MDMLCDVYLPCALMQGARGEANLGAQMHLHAQMRLWSRIYVFLYIFLQLKNDHLDLNA